MDSNQHKTYLALPGFYIMWYYRFASHLNFVGAASPRASSFVPFASLGYVGPIITLCKAAKLPPGRARLLLTNSLRNGLSRRRTNGQTAAGEQQYNIIQPYQRRCLRRQKV